MRISASPVGVCAICLSCLLTCNAQSIAAQSAPTPGGSQEAAASPPNGQAPESAATPAPEASAKPAHTLSLRDRAWEILHAGLAFEGTEKRVKTITALGLMKGNSEAEKLATDALQDSKGDVRAAAATALGTMQARRAKPALEAALDDNEPAVVLAAANSLLLLRDTNFAYDVYYGVLTGTMRTNNGVVKEQIKEQMKILHDKKKIAELGLEQGVGFVPYGGLGYGVVKTLVKNDNSPVRAAAAKKLAHDPDPVTAKALVDATQDKNWLVRVAALEAIAERGDRSLISKVAPSLDDDKDEVRYTGAACIARLSAIPARRRISGTSVASAAVPN